MNLIFCEQFKSPALNYLNGSNRHDMSTFKTNRYVENKIQKRRVATWLIQSKTDHSFLTKRTGLYLFPPAHASRVRIFVVVWRLEFSFDFRIETVLESSFSVVRVTSIFVVGIFGAVASPIRPLFTDPHGPLLLLLDVALRKGLSFASEGVLGNAVCPLVWRLALRVFRWDLRKLTSNLEI